MRRVKFSNIKALSQTELRFKKSSRRSPTKSLTLSAQNSMSSSQSGLAESRSINTWSDSLQSSIHELHEIHKDVLTAEEDLARVLQLQKEINQAPDFRMIHKSFMRVDLAKRKLKDTLENVEKKWDDQEVSIFQRAGELNKESESSFTKMKMKQQKSEDQETEMRNRLEKEMALAKECLASKINAKKSLFKINLHDEN